MKTLSNAAYRRAVALRDLTDPRHGTHAMQLLLQAMTTALQTPWQTQVIEHRANPVVPIEDNYDRLHYPPDGAARGARYTRYVSERLMLRTQTSAMIPELLCRVGPEPVDVLLVCPGLVYRRDAIDRLHTGEPHQVDLWRIRTGPPLTRTDLDQMVACVVEAALPGRTWRTPAAQHPYTVDGLEIEVMSAGGPIEIGECGLALPALLAASGLDPSRTSGLAMGLGLDRLLMQRKGIDDIRQLWSTDPRVVAQMSDLTPFTEVSHHPPAYRDLSLVVTTGLDQELLGDRVRDVLQTDAAAVEALEVRSRTSYAALPEGARKRLGLNQEQENLLLRVVFRHPDRTLTSEQANILRNRVYLALHEGPNSELA
ncbi:MAG: hypothetical protein AAGA48_31295 [Myxococcota bacterium]